MTLFRQGVIVSHLISVHLGGGVQVAEEVGRGLHSWAGESRAGGGRDGQVTH